MITTASKVLQALAPYQLKRENDQQYRCNSPLRPGSNSHAFVIRIDDGEHGAYHDHVSGDSGSLYELAGKLGITPSERQAVNDSKRAYSGMADYAQAHGITAEVLSQAGWYETVYKDRPALAFKTVRGTRWRFLDGEKPYYISEKGYKSCWYGLNSHLTKQLTEHPLILCNGEISAVVARHYGLSAACVTSGEKGLTPDLVAELKAFYLPDQESMILIALDCDEVGRRAALLMRDQLRQAGYTAFAHDLLLTEHGDLADFCQLHGTNGKDELWRALLDTPCIQVVADTPLPEPEQPRPLNWQIIHSSQLHTLPKVEWLIPKEIQAVGLNIIYGASGIGKSFLALDYALRLAQTQNVVYMAGEGVYGYDKRIAAWEKHYGLSRANLYLVTGAVSLLEEPEFQSFLTGIMALNPVLVIVDTLARSMVGGDENSSRDMGLFVRACDKIRATGNCAVLLVHHTNKGKYEERGSYSLRGAADVMIKVSGETDLIMVEMEKVKDEEPLPLRYFRLLPVEVSPEANSMVFVAAENVIQTEKDPLTRAQQKIMSLLADSSEEGSFPNDLAAELHITPSPVKHQLRLLKELGFVQQTESRQPYTITETGRDALERTLKRGNSEDSKTHKTHETHKTHWYQNDHESSEPEKPEESMSLGVSKPLFSEEMPETPAYYANGL